MSMSKMQAEEPYCGPGFRASVGPPALAWFRVDLVMDNPAYRPEPEARHPGRARAPFSDPKAGPKARIKPESPNKARNI